MEIVVATLIVVIGGLVAVWWFTRDLPPLGNGIIKSEIINGHDVLTFVFDTGQTASIRADTLAHLVADVSTDAVSTRSIGFAPWDDEGDED